jgi:uncharacterized OsmC-like protein
VTSAIEAPLRRSVEAANEMRQCVMRVLRKLTRSIRGRLRTMGSARFSSQARNPHPKAGGSGLDLCAGDMLLEALVACAGVSLKAAATMLDVPLASATVHAEGDVDLRGALGVNPDVPVGFEAIRLRFDVETDAPPPKLQQLLELVERYCVVFQTLQRSPRTDVRIDARAAGSGLGSMHDTASRESCPSAI